MPIDRMMRGLAAAVLLASMTALSGCASSIADLGGGDSASRPRDPAGYLPVHDLPPGRNEATMKPAELAKVQAELIAARDRQAAASSAQNPAGK